MHNLLQEWFVEEGFEQEEKRIGMRKRVEWIDALKGVAILLVVFCHHVVLSEDTIVGNVIMTLAWTAVPCFMMASGAVMHQSATFDWRKHFFKLGKMYIILCAWRLIYLLIYTKIQNIHFGKAQLLQYLFFLTDLDGVDTGVMWYMNAYLVMMFLFPITQFLFWGKVQGKYKGRCILLYMAGISAMGGIVIPSVDWGIRGICDFLQVERIDVNGLSALMPFVNHGNLLFYFLAGAFIFEYQDWISRKLKGYRAGLYLLIYISTLGLVFVKYVDSGLFIWGGVYLSEGYSHILTAVNSVAIFLSFMEYEEKWHYVNSFLAKYIGRYTMGIYYLHYALLAICSAVIYPLIQKYYSFMANVAKTIIVTMICAVIVSLLKKIPWVRNFV